MFLVLALFGLLGSLKDHRLNIGADSRFGQWLGIKEIFYFDGLEPFHQTQRPVLAPFPGLSAL